MVECLNKLLYINTIKYHTAVKIKNAAYIYQNGQISKQNIS